MTTEITTPSVTPGVDQAALDAAATSAAAEALAAEQATAAAKEAADKAAAEQKAKDEAAKFEETGDPALDVALTYAASQGLTTESAEIVAARGGDFTKLEAYFKEKNAPGWEKQVALAKGAYDRVRTAAGERAKEIEGRVIKAVGSKTEWEAVRAWAGTEAAPEEKAQINAAFNQGGIVAEAMAAYLAKQYRSVGTKVAKDGAKPDAGTQTGGEGPLTARDYGRAIDAMRRNSKGRDITQSQEYRALNARRTAGRAAGI